MMVKTPFFISPAYSVPRITISRFSSERSMDVGDVIPAVRRFAGESTGIVDHVIRLAKICQFICGRPDQHGAHEEGMVRPRANDANLEPVRRIPSGESIDNEEALSRV